MSKIKKLLIIFILLQPLLDLITSFQSMFTTIPISISILFRGLTLIAVIIYLLFGKKVVHYKKYIIGFLSFSFIYILNIYLNKGTGFVLSELYTLVRFFYFPIMLVFFYHIYKIAKLDIWDKKIIIWISAFYFGITCFAFLTGTSFPSYIGSGKVGYNGWFYSANERGNTYSLLFPLLFFYFIKNKKYIFLIMLAITSMLLLGTKVGLIAVFATLFGTLVYFILRRIIYKEKQYMYPIIVLVFGISILIMTPYLPVYQNIQIQNEKLVELLKEKEKLSEEELKHKIVLEDDYLIEDKGTNLIYSGREVFLNQNIKYYNNQSLFQKWFGLGTENKYIGDLKVPEKVEIDFFDVFFTFGIIGFILYFIPLIIILSKIVGMILRNGKLVFEPKNWFWIVSMILAIAISLFAGHVFVAPSVSIYLILVICSLYNNLEASEKEHKLLFISSTGGHLSEMMQLHDLFAKYDFHIITEKTKSNMYLMEKYPNRVNYLVYGTKSHVWSYMFKFPYNILKSFLLYFKIRPEIIITTGAHTAVPMCYIAKLFGSKIIYIETFANIHTKTITGRMIYPIADQFIVQWESMLKLYPKAIFGGWIF